MKFSIATTVLALVALTHALPMGGPSELQELAVREMDNEIQLRDNGDVVIHREFTEGMDTRDLVPYASHDIVEQEPRYVQEIAEVLEMGIKAIINLAKGIKEDKKVSS